MDSATFLTWAQLGIFIVLAAFLSAAGTSFLVKFLEKQGVVDRPNKRSNHKKPVPKGGGIAVIGAYLFLFLSISIVGGTLNFLWPVLLGTCLIMFVSWMDDINPLSPLIRLLSQLVAVGIVVTQPHYPLFGNFFPEWLDTLIIMLSWVWFINLYNFMDGIDGITCSETIIICLTIAVLPLLANFSPEIAIFAFILAICCAGFLPWNWHPAKIFLGDVGSVPLGYLVGWLLLVTAMYGYWHIAIILPAYYLADSGITLAKRAIEKKKIWEAHSEHFYQQAVRGGKSHSKVVLTITAFNVVLAIIALFAVHAPENKIYPVILAIIVTSALIYQLRRNAKKKS